ncbi:phage tail protein [Sphingomonas sp. PR090111-T3T-6A]|uniref:phage tail protein n=1 Tax=Sphingomonas sp. PR090111-T3T-6A TaxID=685778 RepID=UPI0003780BC5|nr:phage tail protein [Sphingomonas sp. PR090111-T3T-6A]
MLKLQSLSQALARAVPDFSDAPDRFQAYVSNGRLLARAGNGSSFECRYEAELYIIDYSGHPDAIFYPLVQWMIVNQPEQFENDQLREQAVRFDVDLLTQGRCNISITIQMSESVMAESDGKGGTTLTHLDEPGDLNEPIRAADGSELLLREIFGEAPPGTPERLVP